MTNHTVRIYQNDLLTETDIGNKMSFTVGNQASCDVILDFPVIIRLNRIDSSWNYFSDKPLLAKGNQEVEGFIQTGDVLIIDSKLKIAFSIVSSQPSFEKVIEFTNIKNLTIGRNTDCNISIQNRQVSSKHAQLIKEGGQWFVKDSGSSNGTYVNGRLVRESPISSGDIIDICMCRFIITNSGFVLHSHDAVTIDLPFAFTALSVKDANDEYPCQFKRSPRLKRELPSGEFEIEPPPSLWGAPGSQNFLMRAGQMTALALNPNPISIATNLAYTIPYMISGRSQKKKYQKQIKLLEEKYKEYLAKVHAELDNRAEEQREKLTSVNPPIDVCVECVKNMSRDMWDRKPDDNDFMTLRVGNGNVPFCVNIKAQKQTISLESDPLLEAGLEIVEKYKYVKDCPISFDILHNPNGGIIGDRHSAIKLVQSLIIHAATHHSYDDLKIIIVYPQSESESWSGIRWLPHVFDNDRRERYMAANADGALTLLNKFEDVVKQRIRESKDDGFNKSRLQLPYLLFVFADANVTECHGIMRCLTKNEPALGVGAIFMFDTIARLPKECNVIIDVSNESGTIYPRDNSDAKEYFHMDEINNDMLDRFTRSMSPIRSENVFGKNQLPTSISFLEGFGIKKASELQIKALWKNSLSHKTLAVPIAAKANGDAFYFNILWGGGVEYHGPHGLVAGTTRSGKSEMVQTWILSMAVHFPPAEVSFVLIDWKGTSLINPFRNLPHISGTISNIDTNVQRKFTSLEQEILRRQVLFDNYDVTDIKAYLQLYHMGKIIEPLSYLFVVIDEFAEVKEQIPEFIPMINRIFATGASLGIFAVIATQKPSGAITDKMQANARFRWCLKVASSADSKEILRHPDAAKITIPGRAYVQVGEDEIYEQVQSYWSGAPYNPERDPSERRATKISAVNLSGSRENYEPEKTTGYRAEKNEINAIIEYLDNYVRKNNIARAGNIWTEKLPDIVLLDEILPVAFDGEVWNNINTGLPIPVGKIDDPRSQSQYPLRLTPNEDGHFAVYGAPGTGKTTFLQTAVMSTALSFPPDQANIYIMDFGGGSMNIFRELPHLGGIAVAGEDEKIEKLAKLITQELDERRQKFSALGVVNIEAYREVKEDKLPYIILVLDNFAPVIGMYPDLESFFINLTSNGSRYGVYLLVSTGGTMGIPFRIAQNIKVFAALRMADKNDYAAIVGRTEGLEPENYLGRGLIKGTPPLEFQTALPASGKSENERIASIRSIATLMNMKWKGIRPTSIPVMPEHITLDMFHTNDICVGLSTENMSPTALPNTTEPFTIISGKKDEDKSGLLRVLIKQYRKKVPDISIALFDSPLGGLLKVKNHSDVYTSSEKEIDLYIEGLIPELNERRNRHIAEGATDFTALLIAIDDLRTFFDSVSNETIQRLAAIIMLGRGLNVHLLAAGDTDDISKLYNGGDRFTMSMVDKATAVLLGGNFKYHGVFKANVSYSQAEQPLAKGEGYLLLNGSLTRFKMIDTRGS